MKICYRCILAVIVAAALMSAPAAAGIKLPKLKSKKGSEQPLADYMARAAQSMPTAVAAPASPGSLFTPSGGLAEPYADNRARNIGDTIAIRVVESTTISQSGTLASQRDFTHTSGVTGVGGTTPSFLNPLLAGNSSTQLKGTGQADSKSTMNTTLTALVVGVLPNGLLVIEANRKLAANQQHENLTLRGIVRPSDISTANSVYSYQLYNLELEVKGKGILSDTVRQPNIVIRTLLKFIGF